LKGEVLHRARLDQLPAEARVEKGQNPQHKP
jgi:hypothetical protein